MVKVPTFSRVPLLKDSETCDKQRDVTSNLNPQWGNYLCMCDMFTCKVRTRFIPFLLPVCVPPE